MKPIASATGSSQNWMKPSKLKCKWPISVKTDCNMKPRVSFGSVTRIEETRCKYDVVFILIEDLMDMCSWHHLTVHIVGTTFSNIRLFCQQVQILQLSPRQIGSIVTSFRQRVSFGIIMVMLLHCSQEVRDSKNRNSLSACKRKAAYI